MSPQFDTLQGQPTGTGRGRLALATDITVRHLASVASIPRGSWERLLPGDPESWDFYTAIEGSPPPGFELSAIAAFHNDEIIGVAPLFRVSYRIDTPFQGRLRRFTNWIHAHFPRLISFPVVGIGSPMSDNCALGFAPELSDAECAHVFDAMLQHLDVVALAQKSVLLAIKSLDNSADKLGAALERRGYDRVTSVPLVMLELPYKSLDDYLNALPKKTESYLRRKMRGAAKVRIEYRTSLAGLEQHVQRLFESTLHHSKVSYGDFQTLHADYFSTVVDRMGDRAQVMLCWQGDELVSFQLSLVGRDCVLAKQIGMKYPEARDLNLYFVNWLKLIEFAIENRIFAVEMGATTYATKLLFGGYLERRWLHFRFRGRLANLVLRRLAGLFDFEKNDPELLALDHPSKLDMGPRVSRMALRNTPALQNTPARERDG